jgi:hypothetical protein
MLLLSRARLISTCISDVLLERGVRTHLLQRSVDVIKADRAEMPDAIVIDLTSAGAAQHAARTNRLRDLRLTSDMSM